MTFRAPGAEAALRSYATQDRFSADGAECPSLEGYLCVTTSNTSSFLVLSCASMQLFFSALHLRVSSRLMK